MQDKHVGYVKPIQTPTNNKKHTDAKSIGTGGTTTAIAISHVYLRVSRWSTRVSTPWRLKHGGRWGQSQQWVEVIRTTVLIGFPGHGIVLSSFAADRGILIIWDYDSQGLWGGRFALSTVAHVLGTHSFRRPPWLSGKLGRSYQSLFRGWHPWISGSPLPQLH